MSIQINFIKIAFQILILEIFKFRISFVKLFKKIIIIKILTFSI